jgi:hypothetical protein
MNGHPKLEAGDAHTGNGSELYPGELLHPKPFFKRTATNIASRTTLGFRNDINVGCKRIGHTECHHYRHLFPRFAVMYRMYTKNTASLCHRPSL